MSKMENMTWMIDVEEARKSNMLVTGTNQQGKSRLAMALSDVLMRKGWQVIVFDNVGHWKTKSSVRTYFQVSETTMHYVLPRRSIIYDISLLLPSYQKEFVENVLMDVWKSRVNRNSSQWLLVVFEEFQLYARNVRGNVSQNILRIMSVGANHKIRCLGITPDLSLIDCAFIRLCGQRYHFRLGNEPNAKRRFRAYYGLDWCRVSLGLEVGCLIYYVNEKLKVQCVPLFMTDRLSEPYREPEEKPKKSLWQKIVASVSGSSLEPKEDWEEATDEEDFGLLFEEEGF